MNKKVYQAVISGMSDYNIQFNDFYNLMIALGFEAKHQKGSHIKLVHPSGAIMEVQRDGSKAKGYQVKQLRQIIKKEGLE